MGLINDNRPRDWAYRVVFDRKDFPSLQQIIKKINETHDTDIIEDFNSKCEQKLKTGTAQLDNGIEIQQVTKTEDLVVNAGLQQCINIILGTSAVRWSHIHASRHSTSVIPAVTNTLLNHNTGGPYPLALATYGWSEPRGMKLFFGVLGPQDTVSPINAGTITEMGVFNTAVVDSATMLNHEVFFNNSVTRTIAGTATAWNAVFIFSSVIEFCPVA
jgi:hypothetical protein